MAKKIVSISQIDDTFQYLEVEKQPAGFFPHPPPPVITQESLRATCHKADEIYLNGLFPGTLYKWELFPKVAKRYLNNLVIRDAREKLGTSSPVQVQFKTVQEVIDAGIAKWQVAYTAIEEEVLASLWNYFKNFAGKIKFIAPLPVALASAVAQIDHPPENFLIVWVEESLSVISISNSQGLVKVSRSVPIGLPKNELPDNPEYLGQLSQDLGKEISMTLTFFKQQFREPAPRSLYLMGNNHLQEIFQKYPLTGIEFDIHYSLATSPVESMSESQINENMHLIGNLYLTDAFNFLPREEIITRKTNLAFKVAYAFLVVIIVLAGLWGLKLTTLESDKIVEFNNKFSHFQNLQKQVKVLREEVNRLKPFEGWKLFYEDTFQNQPAWNMLLSELSLLVPPNIVIENFQILPEKGTKGYIWNSQMRGKIKAKNWQEGLSQLRQFGGTLQSSPFFEVTNINYAPEKMGNQAKTFDFQLLLKIVPKGSAHDI